MQPTVIEVPPIPGSPPAGYWPDLDLIHIHGGLPRWRRRSVLAHELAHRKLAHRPSMDSIESARQELRADREAARSLISVAEMAEAVRWTGQLAEVAEILEVDPVHVLIRWEMLDESDREWIRRLRES